MTSDWLNPIVVKELRQGLKSRVFSGTFVTLQGLMLLSMVLYLTIEDLRRDMTFVNGFFWFMMAILIVFIMPARAFQAIHEEQKNNTLEMVFLTRMSSWDIAFGKWFALVVQQWLMVAAVLPYLVMRYFLGAINISDDLITLGMMILGGMLLTAAGIGFSGWKSKLLRGFLMSGIFISFYMFPVMLFGASRGGYARYFSDPFIWVSTLIAVVLLMIYLIEYGASLIAPPAENHARRKRILALLILGLYIMVLVVEQAMELIFLGLVFMLPVCVDALCEPLHIVPSLYRHSGRGGRVAMMVRRLFYPGWPSGFIFVVVVLLALSISAILSVDGDNRLIVFLSSLIGTLLLPLAIMLLVRPASSNLMPGYLVLQFVMFIASMLLMVISVSIRSKFDFLPGILPMSTMIMTMANKTSADYILYSGLTSGISMIIIMFKMSAPWSRIIALEKAGS